MSDACGDEDDEDVGDADDSKDSEVNTLDTSPFPIPGTSASQAIPQLVVPGMPKPGDRFKTLKDLYLTAVKAQISVYGISVRVTNVKGLRASLLCNRNHHNYKDAPGGACKYVLAVRKDVSTNNYTVQAKSSYLQHNHDIAPERLANPSWLPKLVNEDARAALGLPPGKRGREKAARANEEKHMPKKRKAEIGLDTASTSVFGLCQLPGTLLRLTRSASVSSSPGTISEQASAASPSSTVLSATSPLLFTVRVFHRLASFPG
ncbi:hypothetical protein JCM11251_004470 [Rhodosporidiobolus azoricus]